MDGDTPHNMLILTLFKTGMYFLASKPTFLTVFHFLARNGNVTNDGINSTIRALYV
jgi:hypothetical protein